MIRLLLQGTFILALLAIIAAGARRLPRRRAGDRAKLRADRALAKARARAERRPREAG